MPENAAAKTIGPGFKCRACRACGSFIRVTGAKLVFRVEIVVELRVDLLPAQVCRRRKPARVGWEYAFAPVLFVTYPAVSRRIQAVAADRPGNCLVVVRQRHLVQEFGDKTGRVDLSAICIPRARTR